MIAGKHSLRMGGEAVQYQLNRYNNFAVRGSLTFGLPAERATPSQHCRTSCEALPPHCNRLW